MSFKDIPIRRKLITIILLISVAVMVLTRIVFFAYEFLAFRQATIQQLSTVGAVIATNSTAALAFENQDDAREMLAALKAEQHITAAALYDARGKLFAKYPADLSDVMFPAMPGRPGYHYQHSSLIGWQRVIQGDKNLGALYLQLDTWVMMRRWLQSSIGIALIVITVALAVAYFLSQKLQKQISQPILGLAETAKAVSDRRDYSVRATKHGEDEMGQLTDAFNQMLSQIQAQDQAIRRDIAERERAKEALRASEAQLQTIVENLDEGLVASDLDGNLLQWNRAALELHGYSASEQDCRCFTDLVDTFEISPLEGGALPVEQWPLGRILRGEKVHDLELRLRRIGSDWERVFSYGGTLVHDAGGKPVMAIVTLNDITKRKRAEEEIRSLNTELEHRVAARTADLEAANKELEAFSYSVSHDLRAPLRAMDGFSHAVLEDYGDQLPEEGRQYLETIRHGAQRMGTLIDDLLTFSRLSRLPLNRQAVNMGRLASDALEELGAQRNGRQIDLRIGDLPPCHGDPSLLRQVWVNLISNAVKYTKRREAAVVEVGAREENGETVYFVSDNGTGFDMQYAHKLFGVFQRLHRADEFEGTGVGLAIVQRVVHRHGGRVWAKAEIDRGASFCFTLGKEATT